MYLIYLHIVSHEYPLTRGNQMRKNSTIHYNCTSHREECGLIRKISLRTFFLIRVAKVYQLGHYRWSFHRQRFIASHKQNNKCVLNTALQNLAAGSPLQANPQARKDRAYFIAARRQISWLVHVLPFRMVGDEETLEDKVAHAWNYITLVLLSCARCKGVNIPTTRICAKLVKFSMRRHMNLWPWTAILARQSNLITNPSH